ncbi:PilZ domain-containing protein [Methylorubrum sp. GM97]|uniref:PilZ domain-containing protein n=1 Tax=Methylorubrum sp. GM97 TaxID=2938232 RepID=UPI0021883B8B|nr:PilZ domain-containing protein [Methylorubrum sp. GM97]BDL37638.1 hypothetical protein MSPGM_02280 [Methylorubrum sp. GM97]
MDTMPVALAGRILLPCGAERDCLCRLSRADEVYVVIGDASAAVGSRVICHVDGLGVIEASVTTVSRGSLRLSVEGSPAHMARLATRLAWHRARLDGREDQRGAMRVIPLDPSVEVTLSDGMAVEARIADLSATGAALEMVLMPPVDAVLTVGRRRARVVRQTDAGIAVRFVLPLRPQDVSADIRL